MKHHNNIKNYKRQRNYVVNLTKKANSNTSIDTILLVVNLSVWAVSKPYFFNKHSEADAGIMLIKNGQLSELLSNTEFLIESIILCKNHPSIENIENNSTILSNFLPE